MRPIEEVQAELKIVEAIILDYARLSTAVRYMIAGEDYKELTKKYTNLIEFLEKGGVFQMDEKDIKKLTPLTIPPLPEAVSVIHKRLIKELEALS